MKRIVLALVLALSLASAAFAQTPAAGYTPGPQFKQILQAVEDAQLEGTIATADEAMALVRSRFQPD